MYRWVVEQLELSDMNNQTRILSLKYLWLNITQTAQIQIASTFLILFLLDIIPYSELGFLFAIQYTLTMLLDYPTSALADVVGYKKILAMAYLTYAFALIFLIFGNTFTEFLPWVILSAIGQSQESGALQSWYDNNYKATSNGLDPDRTVYGAFQGTIQMIFQVISFIMFFLGGVIANVFSRTILFSIQFILVVNALIFIIIIMNNVDQKEFHKLTLGAYYDRLREGIQFMISSKAVFITFLGIAACVGIFVSIWGNLMLYPFYQSYSGYQDDKIGILRGFLYLTSILWTVLITKISKRLNKPHSGLFLSYITINIVFPLTIFAFYTLFPPTVTFVLLNYIGIMILFQFLSPFIPLQIILQNRLLMKLVPDIIRNSVYSLIPTIISLISIPIVVLGGIEIEKNGFISGILFLVVLEIIPVLLVGIGLFALKNGQTSIEKVEKGVKIPIQS
ncbi:MAG: MFS transporter [Candidatus Hodarchaeales archaeon]